MLGLDIIGCSIKNIARIELSLGIENKNTEKYLYLPSSRLYVKDVSADIELPVNVSGTVKSPVTVNVHPDVCGMRNLLFLDKTLSEFLFFANVIGIDM